MGFPPISPVVLISEIHQHSHRSTLTTTYGAQPYPPWAHGSSVLGVRDIQAYIHFKTSDNVSIFVNYGNESGLYPRGRRIHRGEEMATTSTLWISARAGVVG